MTCRYKLLFLTWLVASVPGIVGADTFRVKGTDAEPWAKIFGSIGIEETEKGDARIIVVGPNEQMDIAAAESHLVVVEGAGTAAQSFGFSFESDAVAVRQICDVHAPKMQIIWKQSVNVRATNLPHGFEVFASEKWKSIPVLAGKRTAHGAILWMATDPGATGMEHYPYLLQALVDLGLPIPMHATNLWAFFDSSYRIRADVDYLAKRWRRSGVSVLHVAAWHNMEADPIQDAYLKKLIETCHRNAILVYAWLELPHVSEKFWADHPEWREKTAVGQDAQLDWRKLMNLQNPECHQAIESRIGTLLKKFDWDGVNVAELYFESLEGASNPARFTPMNADVREQFKRVAGFDPKLLFDSSSPYARDMGALRRFLDYRARLASRMQADWLDVIDGIKASKPYLDVVLTHIDDRFEPGVRDALGADVARSLPLIQARHSTLLVEDPATLWNLGPERYSKMAAKYGELTSDRRQIAIDINVVERYQDVYPTKKQTGLELLELVHQASASFARVALYFENSIENQDLGLLAAAATRGRASQTSVDEIETNSPELTRVAWRGPVEIDRKLWPVQNAEFVLAPSGKHRLSPATEAPTVKIVDFNGEILSALSEKTRVDISYTSASRAVATLDSTLSSVDVDGVPFLKLSADSKMESVLLPAGQHIVTFKR